MGHTTLPPGFRFHPTDDELVGYYLKRKIDGLKIELEVIPIIDLYKFDPWELPDKSFLPMRDLEWFFFCPRDRKYPNGLCTNRSTKSGYWKATGKDRRIICEFSVGALRKTLVFYRGRAPGGERTDWIMHEYRLCEDISQGSNNFVGAFALCRVAKRGKQGQKTSKLQGEQRIQRVLSSPTIHLDEHPQEETRSKRVFPLIVLDIDSCRDFDSNISCSDGSLAREPDMFVRNDDLLHMTFSRERGIAMQSNMIGGFYESNGLLDVPQNSFLNEKTFSNVTIQEDEFPYATNAYPSYTLTAASSYANLTGDSFEVDQLNHEHANQQKLDLDSGRFMDSHDNGIPFWSQEVSPIICRQASEVEEMNLWLQEDNFVVVV